jgi:hypothetical protein
MDFIVRQKSFWAEDDESVLRAIREGFMQTHQAMWKELGKIFTLILIFSFHYSFCLSLDKVSMKWCGSFYLEFIGTNYWLILDCL